MLAKIIAVFPMLVIAASVGASAQNLRGGAEPAELPPASFGGAQYVDSAGCVFLRAGVNGNTVWVPRVTRSRKQVCGRAPTFASARQSVEPAPAPAPVTTVQPVVQVAATPTATSLGRRRPTVVAAPAAPVAAVRRQGGIMVPTGFRSAWTDGRLNQNRGPRTDQGNAQMALVWTDTVPRRLVAQK